MKRLFAALLAVLMLTGCGNKGLPEISGPKEPVATAPEAPVLDGDAFHFTRENFPVLDGSTSMVPLGEGIASVLLGESRESSAELIQFHRTTQSFRNLRSGSCDLVIAAEPNAAVFSEMKEAGFAWEMETIAREGLVFVVNENNPVSSLTVQQVRDIFAGKITNWKDVGGADLPIEAFQRNATSGSQVMMEKLVMDGTPMMEAPETNVPTEMGQLIAAVKNYDNSANAIGYTVFYYAADMQMAKGLKLLKIDGVAPTVDSIRTGDYPFVNGYYSCIAASAPADAPARRLQRWLLSEAGQELLRMEGYVPVFGPGEATESGSDVYRSYVNYVPNGGTPAKFTRLSQEKMERLEAGKDYGQILPYCGGILYADPSASGYDVEATRHWGFYDKDFRLITDPVYDTVDTTRFENAYGDFLWIVYRTGEYCSFATPDGSVVSGEYLTIFPAGDVLICDKDGTHFDIFDRSLKCIYTEEDFVVDGRQMIPTDNRNGRFIAWDASEPEGKPKTYLLDADRKVLLGPWQHIYFEHWDRVALYDSHYNTQMLDENLEPLTFRGETKVGSYCPVGENFCTVSLLDRTNLILDRNGSEVAWGFNYSGSMENGGFYVDSGDGVCFYDSKGAPLYGGIVDGPWNYLGRGDLFDRIEDNAIIIRDMATGWETRVEGGAYAYGVDDYGKTQALVCALGAGEDDSTYYLLQSDKEMLTLKAGYLTPASDPVTGERALLLHTSQGQRLMAVDCKTELMRASGEIALQNGTITVTDDRAFTVYSMDGQVLLCYPFYGYAAGD